MKYTQKQIDDMSIAELCDTLELSFAEQNERLEKAEEIKPKLVEMVCANVEIVEEEEDGQELQAELVRTDSINHQ